MFVLVFGPAEQMFRAARPVGRQKGPDGELRRKHRRQAAQRVEREVGVSDSGDGHEVDDRPGREAAKGIGGVPRVPVVAHAAQDGGLFAEVGRQGRAQRADDVVDALLEFECIEAFAGGAQEAGAREGGPGGGQRRRDPLQRGGVDAVFERFHGAPMTEGGGGGNSGCLAM